MFRRIKKTGTIVSNKLMGRQLEEALKIDDVDRKILRALMLDSRLSLRNIAADAGISVGTVREHLGKLQRHGVIKNYTISVDPAKIGYKITAIVQVFITSKAGIGEIESRLTKMPRVSAVYSVTGGSDVIVIARFADAEELNLFVKEILAMRGILRTSTLVVLDTLKEDFRVMV